jgi:hypothetical protein
MSAIDQIAKLVDQGKVSLAPHLRAWAEAHLVNPRTIEVCTDLNTGCTDHVWLVTDHTGRKDSGYRVVYDSDMDMFGLETQIQDGPSYLLGLIGTFAETIESM